MKDKTKHLAVIMARGESLRMGQPKGLCKLSPSSLPFIIEICRLYLNHNFTVLVVVNHNDEQVYLNCLSGLPVEVLSADVGGETAQTMNIAMQWAAGQNFEPVCFWAHPVDMPLVKPETISQLQSAFNANDSNALRPWFGNQPGHPVLFSRQVIAIVLKKGSLNLTMAAAWKIAANEGSVQSIKKLSVDDSGVIVDFDCPDQIKSFRPMKES